MKYFEEVYKELETLFIEKLPDYIEKINKEHNDGLILKAFENSRLEENCINLPSFKFAFEEAEYEEKDRIIENTVYEVSFELKLQSNTENQTILLSRYIEAINFMIEDTPLWQNCRITKIKKNTIFIRITM